MLENISIGDELEKNLIQKCMQNDAVSFGKIVQSYRIQLFSYLFRLCGDRMAAEDLFQETLIRAWSGLKLYNEQNKFSSWLFSIAHNVAVDSIRRDSIKKNTVYLDDVHNAGTNENPQKMLEEKEAKELIISALDELNENQKNVFLLRQHSGMSFKEIASEMNQSLNTVLSHMNYAVSKIKKRLIKEYG